MNTSFLSLRDALGARIRVGMATCALWTACALGAGLHDAAAQGADAAPGKLSGKEYNLTRTSSFDAPDANSRNPFWPIGWVPGPVAAAQTAAIVYDVKPENFVLTTTSVDYPPLAIINGKSYGVGETVPVAAAGSEVVKVKRIQDGVVFLDHKGRELRIVSGAGALKGKQ